MKSRTLYALVTVVGLVAMLAAVLTLGLCVFGSIVERRLRTDLLSTAVMFLAAAVALHALWDTGTRLLRVEEAQRRLEHELEKARDERPTA